MEYYLQKDIISYIIKYLTKDESFNFLNTVKFLKPLKILLYEKYLFSHKKIENDEIRQYINKLEHNNLDQIDANNNLRKLDIFYTIFCSPV